jgi:hypothetical protein
MFLDDSITEKQFVLLNNEASLAAMSLSQGLTFLRKHDFIKKSYALHAFFSLSIGLERLMKLTLIYDYRLKNNNSFPTNNFLKGFGHHIINLYEESKKIANSLNQSSLYHDVESDPICKDIIIFLSEFASKSRYYNLDTLTGKFQPSEEPLKGWEEIIESQILKRHYKPNENKNALVMELGSRMDEFALTSFHDKSGNHINSYKDLLLKGLTVETSAKYAALYLYKIIRFLSKLIYEIDVQKLLPMISEHFILFRSDDTKFILTRKTWNLYGR